MMDIYSLFNIKMLLNLIEIQGIFQLCHQRQQNFAIITIGYYHHEIVLVVMKNFI